MGKHRLLPWLLAILAILLVVLWSKLNYGEKVVSNTEQTALNTKSSSSLSSNPAPTVKTRPKPKSISKKPGLVLNYQEALSLYNDWRVQFDSGCRALPARLVVKTGDRIMFDNRTADTKLVNIDGQVYTFPAYGFQIITLSSQNLPHEFNLDCQAADSQSENSNTIIVQR